MSKRSVKATVPTHVVREGGGFKVRRPVAMGSLMSPFLLLDEMGPVNYGPKEAIGAPSHPHRGFETVTYLLHGSMQHQDSAGNSGDLNPGDVQWMTAGRGIIHSELPHPDFYDAGGGETGFYPSPTVLCSVGHPLPKRGPQCAMESSPHARLRS